MSVCISTQGEFSSHELDAQYTCTLCHVLDEDALRAELTKVKREFERLMSDYNGRGTVINAHKAKLDAVSLVARRTADENDRLKTELAEMQALFDLQSTRMGEATARWQAESPQTRANVMPDLGELLTWLMAQTDEADRRGWHRGWDEAVQRQTEFDNRICQVIPERYEANYNPIEEWVNDAAQVVLAALHLHKFGVLSPYPGLSAAVEKIYPELADDTAPSTPDTSAATETSSLEVTHQALVQTNPSLGHPVTLDALERERITSVLTHTIGYGGEDLGGGVRRLGILLERERRIVSAAKAVVDAQRNLGSADGALWRLRTCFEDLDTREVERQHEANKAVLEAAKTFVRKAEQVALPASQLTGAWAALVDLRETVWALNAAESTADGPEQTAATPKAAEPLGVWPANVDAGDR